MCQFFSGVVTKTGIVYDLDADSHEFLLEKAGLEDGTPFPNFVRVELLPKDGNVFNHDLNNWALRMDQDYLPEWFDKEAAEEEMKKLIQLVFKERFIIGEPSWQKRHGQRVWVKDANVKIVDGRVVARGNSSVEAYGNSLVKAYGNSAVKAYGNSLVEVWGHSKVEAQGNSSVIAYENSLVKAYGNSSIVAWGNSSVEAYGNSSVVILISRDVKIKGVYDNAIIRDFSGNSPKIIIANKDLAIEYFEDK